jgi:putative oxidoreductase
VLKKVLFGGESGLSVWANAGLALLRIYAGIALAFAHGINKLPPSEAFIERTGSFGFPVPAVFAWAAAFSEFLGGIFLAIGLFTRISSFFIICTMLTALIFVHGSDPFSRQELPFFFLFTAIAFLLKGSGDWSLDAYLRK